MRAAGIWGHHPHLVDEPMQAFLTATRRSAGTGPARIGPLPMVAVAGQLGILEATQSLPLGQWTVVTETIKPAVGRSEVQLEVGTAQTGFPPDFPPRFPPPDNGFPMWSLLPIAILTIIAATFLLRRPLACRRS